MRDRTTHLRGSTFAGVYQLVEPLGDGATGTVWRARSRHLRRDVALELMHGDVASSPAARARLRRASQLATTLRHEHAVKVHAFGEDDGQPWLAMDMLDGATFEALLARRESPTALVDLLAPVTDALVAAHDIGLVHGGVAPKAIFVEERAGAPQAVLADFGVGAVRDPSEGRLALATGYTAPESFGGGPLGPEADVYSLGCVLYEVLTHEPVFEGFAWDLPSQHLFETPVPPSERRRDLELPRRLEDLCERMLRKSPAERPTMRQVAEELRSGPVRRRRPKPSSHTRLRPPPGPNTLAAACEEEAQESFVVAVVGTLEGDLVLQLGSSGLHPYIVTDDQPIEGADVIFAPGAGTVRLLELAELMLPLVTDVAKDEPDALRAFYESGVDEIVRRPVDAEQLAQKLRRAIRHHQAHEPAPPSEPKRRAQK